jgi:hypothetical protein
MLLNASPLEGIENVPVVRDFPDVFPEELPGIPFLVVVILRVRVAVNREHRLVNQIRSKIQYP